MEIKKPTFQGLFLRRRRLESYICEAHFWSPKSAIFSREISLPNGSQRPLTRTRVRVRLSPATTIRNANEGLQFGKHEPRSVPAPPSLRALALSREVAAPLLQIPVSRHSKYRADTQSSVVTLAPSRKQQATSNSACALAAVRSVSCETSIRGYLSRLRFVNRFQETHVT